MIRSYAESDWGAVYDICHRTAGDDYSWTPDRFAGPYLYLEPELAFVVDCGAGPVGYVLGSADSTTFAERWGEWENHLGHAVPFPPAPLTVVLAGYPAHLHIDILSEHQRMGHGRELIEAFCGAVDAEGVHVSTMAVEFFRSVGFHDLGMPTFLGRHLR